MKRKNFDSVEKIKIPYKIFFHCECPNLRGDGTNHTLKNCNHYIRSQFKKFNSDQLLINKNARDYKMRYKALKKRYKVDYDIFFYVKHVYAKKP